MRCVGGADGCGERDGGERGAAGCRGVGMSRRIELGRVFPVHRPSPHRDAASMIVSRSTSGIVATGRGRGQLWGRTRSRERRRVHGRAFDAVRGCGGSPSGASYPPRRVQLWIRLVMTWRGSTKKLTRAAKKRGDRLRSASRERRGARARADPHHGDRAVSSRTPAAARDRVGPARRLPSRAPRRVQGRDPSSSSRLRVFFFRGFVWTHGRRFETPRRVQG